MSIERRKKIKLLIWKEKKELLEKTVRRMSCKLFGPI